VPEPTVIQTEQAPDNLLIGDLLSLDIPAAGPIANSTGGGGGGGLGGDLDLLGDLGGLSVSSSSSLIFPSSSLPLLSFIEV